MPDQKEILESIRDIIAGNGDDDVLDLTQKVNPDGSVTEIKPKTKKEDKKEATKPEPKAVESAKKEPAKETGSDDILSEIDSILTGEKPKPKVADKDVVLEFGERPIVPEKFEITEEFEAPLAPKSDAEIKQEAKELTQGAS